MIDNGFIKISQQQFEQLENSSLFKNATRDLCDGCCVLYVTADNQSFALKNEYTYNRYYATKNVMELK